MSKMMLVPFRAAVLAFVALLALASAGWAAELRTPVQVRDLDAAACAQWVDGRETPCTFNEQGPKWVLATQGSIPAHSGVTFGVSDKPGVRHLRIGFTRPLPAGTLLVHGGGRVSVLRPDAPYPGDLNNEAQWLPAARQEKSGGLALWLLPPHTVTRALRFTDVSPEDATTHAGRLDGACLLAERLQNLAPQGAMVASVNQHKAARLADGSTGGWGDVWDNGEKGGEAPVSPANAPWVMCAWPAAVTLDGVCVVAAGCGRVEVQQYAGPDNVHPREADETQWKTVGAYPADTLYPSTLPANWLVFDTPVTTRALRLRIVGAIDEARQHPHVKGKSLDGKRVWLGELMFLHHLGDGVPVTLKAAELQPPIPVTFTLPEAGLVTLVIERAGVRVRNLISETPFPAGSHTAYWDGLDESGRVNEGYHGIYQVQGALVAPDAYTVRGLYRKPLELRYEFTPNNAGSPPWWGTADGKGGWLADHSPPSAVLFLPEQQQVLVGAYVAEAGDGIIWVDLQGRKQAGKRWVGGIWTGASHLARDVGAKPLAAYYAYTGSTWEGALRLYGIHTKGETQVVKYTFAGKDQEALGGLAACNGLLVASLPKAGQLLVVDVAAGTVQRTIPVEKPQGVAFDSQGALYVVSGTRVLRLATLEAPPQPVITDGLEEPQQLLVDPHGRIYVSDWGKAQQVKLFGADGKLLRAVGAPGGARIGAYDRTRMQSPYGMTLTADGQLWVAEQSYTPKRVSVWAADGGFVTAFYGPPQYGGGGNLDPQDRTKFYYADEAKGTLEFTLDWDKGSSALSSILYLPGSNGVVLPGAAPQRPMQVNGRRYFTNVFSTSPVSLAAAAGIWMQRDGNLVPVAAAGQAQAWELLKTAPFKAKWPAGADLTTKPWEQPWSFCWTDNNGDGQAQPDEVVYWKEGTHVSGVYVAPDLTLTFSTGRTLAPKWTTEGTLRYPDDMKTEATIPGSSQVLQANGWTVAMGGPLRGYQGGALRWTYPNQWPSLHAGQLAPATALDRPGLVIATTRLIGQPVTVAGETLWAVNSDKGTIYLFTPDGLFVATLFTALGSHWTMPQASRGMLLNGITHHGEDFWPTLNQTADGRVYLVVGQTHSSLVRVDGLDTLRRLPETKLTVTPAMLQACREYFVQRDLQRVKTEGRDTLPVALRKEAPAVDGKLDDWGQAAWVTVGHIVTGGNQAPIQAAIATAGDRLYVALKTPDSRLLENKGDAWLMLFKTGGGLDVMLHTDQHGDQRLLTALVNGKPLAVRYRPKAEGAGEPVPFSSPWRTVTMAEVAKVPDVELAGAQGNFELSVPLAALGLQPRPGLRLRGDIGILRGSGGLTAQRLYWQNKATGLVSDVPGEAELAPQLWGWWEFGQ
jgi:DNA-binding beta-propeller fold protein YncE